MRKGNHHIHEGEKLCIKKFEAEERLHEILNLDIDRLSNDDILRLGPEVESLELRIDDLNEKLVSKIATLEKDIEQVERSLAP